MKKVAFGVLAVAAMACGGGCSSGESAPPPGPDFAAVEQRFAHPDGTLTGGNVNSALSSAKGGGSVPMLGGGSTGSGQTAPQSFGVRPLANAFADCAALASGERSGSCACPEGGSLSWDLQGSNSGSSRDVTVRVGLDACGADGSVIDGSEYLRMQTTGSGEDASFSMIAVLDATVTKGGESHKLELQMRMKDEKLEFAAKVDDGWVIVSFSGGRDGSEFTVRARNGSWTCKSGAEGGACTSDTGETVTFGP